MHQFVPANRDIDMRRQTSAGHSQSNLRFNMNDRVAFRAGGGIDVTVTPEMSAVDLARSIMSAANAYLGFPSGAPDYRYTSLEPEEDAIRLLALFPGQQAEEVKCKIVHTTLSEKPHYEALSYTWGQVKTCAWIKLEQVPFPITTNLYGALEDLRLADQIRYLWVDSVCIDQYNDREKCSQVQRMATIYSQAHRVLAWLGPSASNSDMAIDFVNGDVTAGSEEAETPEPFWESVDHEDTVGMVELKTSDTIQITEDATYDASDSPRLTKDGDRRVAKAGDGAATLNLDEFLSSENRHDSEEFPPSGLDSGLKESGNHEDGIEINDAEEYDHHAPELKNMRAKTHLQRALIALDCLVRRPWWRRVWVSQEVASPALEPILICGRRAFTLGQLQAASNPEDMMFAPSRMGLAPRVVVSVLYRVSSYAYMRQMVRHECLLCGPPKLTRLLRGSLILEATDARDKVYALLGLADDREKLGIVPDYTKSLSEVYTDVTRNVFRTSGELNLLCFNTNSERLLPSWASDWSLGSSRPRPLWHHGRYNAAANMLQQMNPIEDPSILDVAGVLVDKVRFQSGVIYLDMGDLSRARDTIRGLMSLVYLAIGGILPRQDQTDNEKMIRWKTLGLDPDPRNSDCFWRTLVANDNATASIAMHFSKPGHKIPVSTQAPEEYAEMFEILMYASDDGSEVDSTSQTRPRRRLSQILTSVELKAPRLRTKHFSRIPDDFMPGLSFSERRAAYVRPLLTMMAATLQGRVLFTTNQGYIGLCSGIVEKGDLVSVLLGCDMPIVLREYDAGYCLRVIGEAYVHGIMDGEAVRGLTRGQNTRILNRFRLK